MYVANTVHFQEYFSCITEVSFIGGGKQYIWRKPQTNTDLLQVIDIFDDIILHFKLITAIVAVIVWPFGLYLPMFVTTKVMSFIPVYGI
jgi:hypothetical protein